MIFSFRHFVRFTLLAAFVIWAAAPGSAHAQNLGLPVGESNMPIEVLADHGIDWLQKEKVVIARGNAQATRGEFKLNADELRAHYSDRRGGGADISQLEAIGNVVITGPTETITGTRATYDVSDSLLVVYAGDEKPVRLQGRGHRLMAKERIQFNQAENKAMAIGKARHYYEGRTVSADTLVAYFEEGGDNGQSSLKRVEAHGNVVVVTERDTVRASKGVYNVATEKATLTGKVRISSNQAQLAGGYAEVNMKTGISRLLTQPGQKKGRVRGLLIPSKKSSGQQGG